ncbi:DNA-binding transcriptional regulator, GntR family [Streptomyces sp. LamerLS-316]|uniref:GntR family transcriptional regulator n=1 Tax=unclassified Streptomyces TaxID=2593676 RepID=UPI000823A851|nr:MULTISPECIES: GntR family transcriptional regulator [unclassified Streptomyces]MYQ43047.1 GntR family transcriptional regulator [Streptomyces sp. SID4921]SCK34425.1 DNA-binding transcriptional regulator, GntR family [Streptomyces sp. LamerLS-316]
MAGTTTGGTNGGGAPDLSELATHSASLKRSGTAERVAVILRDRITEGYFPPGSRLSEESISGALAVSRNTLREAFRLLSHERLLEHRLNRGVFVRILAVDDLIDIYRVRLLVECAALRALGEPPFDLAAVEAAVSTGEQAALRDDWAACSTANIRFHQALAGLANSARTDELMRNVLAELRLAFHVMADPRRFHEPYLTRNREITDRLAKGDAAGAERMLAFYLEDSRRQLAEAYAQRLTEC